MERTGRGDAKMARIFISFAMEDRVLRDFLVGQKLNSRSSISFTDYSVKEPWSSKWKTNCRSRIKLCNGMIGIITRNTPGAAGQIWELDCAINLGTPLLLIHGHRDSSKRLKRLPSVISGRTVHPWTESNLVRFLDNL